MTRSSARNPGEGDRADELASRVAEASVPFEEPAGRIPLASSPPGLPPPVCGLSRQLRCSASRSTAAIVPLPGQLPRHGKPGVGLGDLQLCAPQVLLDVDVGPALLSIDGTVALSDPPMKESLHVAGLPWRIPAQCNSCQSAARTAADWPPRGSGATAPQGALRAIDSTARLRSWRACGPRRLRQQSELALTALLHLARRCRWRVAKWSRFRSRRLPEVLKAVNPGIADGVQEL
jgi:hypothetical protein